MCPIYGNTCDGTGGTEQAGTESQHTSGQGPRGQGPRGQGPRDKQDIGMRQQSTANKASCTRFTPAYKGVFLCTKKLLLSHSFLLVIFYMFLSLFSPVPCRISS